jgi:hypothetical protein
MVIFLGISADDTIDAAIGVPEASTFTWNFTLCAVPTLLSDIQPSPIRTLFFIKKIKRECRTWNCLPGQVLGYDINQVVAPIPEGPDFFKLPQRESENWRPRFRPDYYLRRLFFRDGHTHHREENEHQTQYCFHSR